jgi:hypothetical protein
MRSDRERKARAILKKNNRKRIIIFPFPLAVCECRRNNSG